MKQSGVLLHSKVKKVLYEVHPWPFSFHIHQFVHNLDTDQRSKVYHGAFAMHFLVWVQSERRQVLFIQRLFCIGVIFFFSFFYLTERKVSIFFFGIRHFLTVHIHRATTKLPDMFIECWNMCSTTRWHCQGAVDRFFFCCSLLLLLFFLPAALHWITTWVKNMESGFCRTCGDRPGVSKLITGWRCIVCNLQSSRLSDVALQNNSS